MKPSVSTILPSQPLKQSLLWVALGLLLLSPALFYLLGFRGVISVAYFAGLGAVVLLANPRWAFVVFLLSLGIYVRFQVGPMMVMPVDAAAFFVTGAVVFEYFLRGYVEIRRTPYDLAFAGLIAATILSVPLAYNIDYTFVPTLRIIVIYLSFRFVFKLAIEIGVRKVLLWYLYFVTALSVYNCLLFVSVGGQSRIFGPSWLAFETYSMTALPMSLAILLWSRGRGERLQFGMMSLLIAVALVATQSRAPLLAALITVPGLFLFAARKRRREGNPIRLGTAFRIVVVAGAGVLTLLLVEGEIFVGLVERVERLVQSIISPQGTIALRIVLWTAAIKAFMTNPLTGIGIGNFKIVDQIIPEVKLVPVWYYIGGLSAHNVVLHYLAETGIIGAFSLIALAWTGVRNAFRSFRRPQSDNDTQVSAALFIGMFVFALTILYMRAWTWGLDSYILALIFGLNAAWQWKRREQPA